VKFLRFKDKLPVLEKAKRLKGSFVFIDEDLSDAVSQRRKEPKTSHEGCKRTR
jgi:hypothetical protein